MVDITKLTEYDIQVMKDEIQKYYQMRKLFLILAFVLLGGGLLFIIIGIVSGDPTLAYAYGYIGGILLTGMIAMFVLRSAVFNTKINNRNRAIKAYNNYHHSQNKSKTLDEQ